MFKLFRFALLLVVAVLTGVSAAVAQSMPSLPVDSAVRIGQLPNGLTYFIRHNEKPKGQADFYIAQKVGSILEEDNQRGLAHFLEHMCFNGTTHFPGNSLITWLETKGVRFGYNLNAYTSIDETVYNISNVPVNDVAVQDSCLLILHDWANDLTLDPEEIDKERGVIHQEWRTMNGARRLIEAMLPLLYPDNRYGVRFPIGTMEVVDNFPPQALRDYYETWYRPDQQGIVIVGDIDVDYIEGKIKEIFSDIEMPENAKSREYFPVEDNDGILFAIGSDPEITTGEALLFFKNDAFPDSLKSNPMYLIQDFANDMLTSMLNTRLSDMAATPDAPFASASSFYDNYFYAKTKDALTLEIAAKDDDIMPGIEAAYRELLRAQRGGFTESEYNRARSEFLSRLEKKYEGRDAIENEAYVKKYVRHFIDNEPIPSVDNEFAFFSAVAPMITVDNINSILDDYIDEDNRVFLLLAPKNDKFKIPTEEEVANLLASVEAEDIEPYQDAMKAEPLIPELPAPGKVVSVTDDAQWGAKVVTLSNGVKVYVKPTDFKKGEIRFEAIAIGGTSVEPDEALSDIMGLGLLLPRSGLGDYTATDLQRYLQGKQASVSFDVEDYYRTLEGSSTPKDLQYLMEMIYMTFVDLASDPDEFKATQNMIVSAYANIEKDPNSVFAKHLQNTLYESALKKFPTAEVFKNADREGGLKLAHKYLANAADYTFFFVGDIDMDTLLPLLEQYVATLPSDPANVNNTYVPNPAMEWKPGTGSDFFTMKMETPQTVCAVCVEAELPYTPKNRQLISMAAQILSNRLLKTIREDMGAVYSIGAGGQMSRQGKYNTIIQVPFPMKPEARDEVISEVARLINDMKENISEDELKPAKEFVLKNIAESKESNAGWIGTMGATALNGVDIFNGIEDVINAVTVDDVKAFMTEVLGQGNYRVVVLDPEQ